MQRAAVSEGEVALMGKGGPALNSIAPDSGGSWPCAAGSTPPGHVRGVQAGQLTSLGLVLHL